MFRHRGQRRIHREDEQPMVQLDECHFDAIAEFVGDTPFAVTPYFLLRRRACNVYADAAGQPRYVVVVPHAPRSDVYVLGAAALAPEEWEELADFLVSLEAAAGYMVPVELVPAIRTRRRIHVQAEGLCFTYRRPSREFAVWRPENVRQLTPADVTLVNALPGEADFLYQHYGTPLALLTEGVAFGVMHKDRLVSMAASLALTPRHCDVGVYTRPRYRSRGYATDCVETLFAHVLARNVQPLWRIGGRQKIAIYFAEKLEMDEIGTDGREVYLQTRP